MGEKKYTLIELHLDGDTQFGLGSVTDALLGTSETTTDADPASTQPPVATDEEETPATDEESNGPGAVGVLIGLVALVAVAVAVKKFRGGADEPDVSDPVEEPEVVVD